MGCGAPRRLAPAASLAADVIDSHTHLDQCAEPNTELVAAADAVGVRRILTVGMDGASCRTALAAAEAFPQVYAAIGRHPNLAHGFDGADLDELRALAAHHRCLAIGETGLDFYRAGAPVADQQRAFEAQIELAREVGKPLIIHTRAAEDQTIATLDERAGDLAVVLHCFSMPDRLEECLAARLVDLLRRQRHLPERRRPGRGRPRGPG